MNPPLTIDQLVADWDLSPDKAPIGSQPLGKRLTFTDILGVLRYADKNAFSDYIPTRAPSFFDRLLIWLQNQGVTEADQQVLFEFASHLNYFSLEDFKAMYRAAFTGPRRKSRPRPCSRRTSRGSSIPSPGSRRPRPAK